MNKYNCFLVNSASARSSLSSIISGEARPSSLSSKEIISLSASSKRARFADMELDRDDAIRKCAQLQKERDEALVELERWQHERNDAIRSRERLVDECEKLRQERDKALESLKECSKKAIATEAETILLREKLHEAGEGMATAVAKNDLLLSDSSRLKVLLGECSEKVKSLTSRVVYLKSISKNKAYVAVSTLEKNKLRSIRNFAAKLSPSLNRRQQLTSIFDELCSTLKSFRKHVKSKLRTELSEEMKREVCKQIKKYYAPWRFLEVMDCSQQSLNQVSKFAIFLNKIVLALLTIYFLYPKECYKSIYSIQKDFPKWAKILPEIKGIRAAQKKLNAHLSEVIPIKYAQDRETGWFEYRKFTEYMLKKNGLMEIIDDPATTEPVIVAVTFDGGKVSRFFSHVTGGFKQVDKQCINPRTKEKLFADSGIEKVQSHVHCFPIKAAFAKDTKASYKVEFKDFLLFLKTFEQEKQGRI